MFMDLNFLHFLVTVIVLLILIVSHTSKYYHRRRKYDEAMSKPWGLVGNVDSQGNYFSRVPSEQSKNTKIR